ncbi:hypothetical protein ACFVUS_24610 [Nocardia sp. NPDC058058]|uniref:hypothetical protein n=1 Tax=Nocardia sp. NPDC058058 TaxID=3346317 RepID=UPI0036D7AB81
MLRLPRIRRALAAIALVVPALTALTGTAAADADAEATTWTVTNPNADGAFTATSGKLTVKNSSGTVLFTCASLTSRGKMAAGTRTRTALGTIDTTTATPCSAPDGTVWNATGVMMGESRLVGNSYNAATGTTSITNGPDGVPINVAFASKDTVNRCAFYTYATAMTYTNATSALKATTAKVKISAANGVPNCVGLLTQDETITYALEYKVTPAIKITAS